MEDYQTRLADITKAFNDLTAAGKLTVSQQDAVKEKIQQLKDEIADFQKPFLALANAKPFDAVAWSQSLESPFQRADDKLVHLISSVTGVDEGLVRVSLEAEHASKAFDGFPRQFFGTAAYDQLTDAGKRLDEIGGYVLKVDPKHLEETAAWLQKMGAFGSLVPPEMDKIVNALKTLGVSNARDDVSKLNTAFDGLNLALQTGAISQGEYNRGFVKYVDDLKNEGVQIDSNTQKVYDQIQAHQENLKAVQEFGAQGKAIFKGVFEGVENDFAGMVTTANFSLDAMAKTGQKFAQDFLAMMLKGLFKPLETAFENLGKQIGSAIGGIFAPTAGPTGAAGPNTASIASAATASNPASGVTGASGALGAAGGLTGIVTAVSSVVTAVSSVVGNFQMAHMSSDLQKIEASTRYLSIYTGGQSDSILQTLHVMRDMTNTLIANTAGMVRVSLSGTLSSDESNNLIDNLVNGSQNFYSQSYDTFRQILQAIVSGDAQIVGQLHAGSSGSLLQKILGGSAFGGLLGSLTQGAGAGGGIAAVASAASELLGGAHMNNLLGEIEVSTRGALNELLNARADQWTQYNGIFGRLGEMWRDMRDGLAQVKGNGSGGGASNNGTNNFYFYGASLDDITRELKLAGVLS